MIENGRTDSSRLSRLVRRIARQIRSEAAESRRGKGPWMVWFPKKTQRYISGPIKTKTDLQALGSWLAAETEGRFWHNTVFQDHNDVMYRGKKYTKEEGKFLYQKIVKDNDWESVDLGSPEVEVQGDDSLRTIPLSRSIMTPNQTSF